MAKVRPKKVTPKKSARRNPRRTQPGGRSADQKASAARKADGDRFRSLVDIGIALSSEKEVSRILDLILEKALETTEADAASISLTENIRIDSIGMTGQKFFPVLRFSRNANRNSQKRLQDKVLSIDDSSIAGYVALTGETVVVDDCYELLDPKTARGRPYKFNPQVDTETKYRTISMLALPMQTSNGKVRGVVQILNKIKPGSESAKNRSLPLNFDDVIPFADQDVELMKVFASQACVAIENAKLTEDIENLFESFIRASVTAIEARDPATSGHSDRVAVLTVEFARAVHICPQGPMKDLVFSEGQIRELRYAALLHDFGKIGVRESVLAKQFKLYPHEMETILLRLDSARARQEMLVWKEMAHDLIHMLDKGEPHTLSPGKLIQTTKKIDDFAIQLQQVRQSIMNANQPQVVAEDFDITSLMKWINQASTDLNHTLLTPEEIIKLSLPKGSLSPEERKEIESHVSHTYHFLRQIAWTEDLADVADIAHAHHEKCDGTGYPRGLTCEHIPVQARLMTIADIYDALTSMDRPYKPATTPERALEILEADARKGKLDKDLLKIFIDGQVFKSADGMRLRKTG
jgi:HD-GYP domain-containing protein (c-di-GMP phosphodiesterase class II)